MLRTILHLDLDAFFCAVEELHDPSLRGKAFAVGGRPEQRGVVASCSYAARGFGVHSAMPTIRALRLCPGLLVISHHHGNYGEMSDKVMERLHNLSPFVEQISIDEAFVDISGLGDPAAIARKLQAEVREGLGLPCSVGIAANKLVAKIATNVGKKTGKKGQPPNALTIVAPGGEAAFLDPLPVDMLWGVGPKTGMKLAGINIKTIGDLARHPEEDLVRWFGVNGHEMWLHARGVDERPITTEYEAKSISQEVTFARDVSDDLELNRTAAKIGPGRDNGEA
jgi:DNA polymerase-4